MESSGHRNWNLKIWTFNYSFFFELFKYMLVFILQSVVFILWLLVIASSPSSPCPTLVRSRDTDLDLNNLHKYNKFLWILKYILLSRVWLVQVRKQQVSHRRTCLISPVSVKFIAKQKLRSIGNSWQIAFSFIVMSFITGFWPRSVTNRFLTSLFFFQSKVFFPTN